MSRSGVRRRNSHASISRQLRASALSETGVGPYSPDSCATDPAHHAPSMRTTHRVLGLAAAIFAVSFFVSCASSGKSHRGTPVLVAYINPKRGENFELVNSSHTDRVQLYSESRSRDEAMRKVTSDELMDALLERFEQLEFDKYALAGQSTAEGPALEVVVGGSHRSIVWEKEDTLEEKRAWQACLTSFLDLYNSVYGLQSVEISEGEDPFARPATSRTDRR